MWYAIFKYGIFVGLLKFLVRPKITGLSNVPKTGGVVLAGNHGSAWETVLVPAAVHRQITFPAKSELFAGKGLRNKVVAWFLRVAGQVPIDRTGGQASSDSLQPVVDALASGKVVGIFPEGTRTPDGHMYRGKTGVARLALGANVPVIPVGLINTQPVKGFLGLPKFRGTEIRFGEPISFPQYANRPTDREVLRWVTNEVMSKIQELTGQEYYDCTATSVKRGLTPQDRQKYARATPNAGQLPPAIHD